MSLKPILTGLVASLLISSLAQAESKYVAANYQVDPMHSKVGFEIPHLVISTVDGRFTKFDGGIDLAEKFDKSKVNVTVDMSSIDTGVQKRDDHLKSPDFFDVAKHPNMKFESTAISGTPEDFKLTGNLTIKGVTKKVTFDGKYLGAVKDGYGQDKTAFQAKTKINRKDFGLTWNKMLEVGPTVGDEVTIDLRIQAAKTVAKK
jgi:polyisoprenoid-binding protein YceI